MRFVDTHCHLDMLEDVPGVLERMRAAGVARAVTIGVDVASSARAIELAREHDGIAATVGLHPHDAKDGTPEAMEQLRALALDPHVVGIGEAGLDYYYDNSPRDRQCVIFAEQIGLSRATGKALVIHSRDAWDDTFGILEAEGPPERFVFHCFSGGPAEAARAVAMGATLSFAGVVTFKNAEALREAARATPLDRIVVETDSPFLTPVPHRGRPNEPAYVEHTARALAEIKSVSLADFAAQSWVNAAGLFGWEA